jgi:ribosomal protein S18 acetylase RimI-like enzyme
MAITYKEIKEFEEEGLRELFLSVGWSSGAYPDKLKIAMNNSATVISAWDDNQLIGLINALDDGVMTAYIHYLLIHPYYHHQGIGNELVARIKAKYESYLRVVLIAYDQEIPFYEHQGFEKGIEKTPMFITSLWT